MKYDYVKEAAVIMTAAIIFICVGSIAVALTARFIKTFIL
ncbi:hypothetical protein GTGU_03600 [Trabulsiella guamensis ATCC 49490]|uniref:Uncharacterized protein n=1 Tax=Trabulsiella guamensis ATCC 49490 TaxID=1005994 RepID=A0A084ZUD8_9ENTR|nr:hypothetical protein GTGU_03600 [Trabulsiella guamensis ATCC 49490]